MKKNQIKFVGVCAAALLTVGALTPVTTTVFGGEAGVAYAAKDFTGHDTLKKNVSMTLATLGDNFAEFTSIANNPTGDKINWANMDVTSFKPLNLLFDLNKVPAGENAKKVVANLSDTVTYDPATPPYVRATSTFQPGKVYEVGDTFTVTFTMYANDTMQNELASGTSTITIVAEQTNAYSVVAPDITVAVGDNYVPAQGITVVNKNTNKQLTWVDATVAHNSAALDELGLKPGQYYYFGPITTDFDADGKLDSQTLANGTTQKVWNKTALGANTQNVGIIIPGVTSIIIRSRTITVQDPTDVIAENVYRAYNANNGDHLFTTSLNEFNDVVGLGWGDEGVAWVAQTNGAKGGYPVYRVYNANSGEHFYTASKAEYINLGNAGWKQEGVAFFSAAAEGNTAVYRAFNPNATGPGSHMFTTSKTEYDNIVKAGWTGEGVAFYGLAQD